MATKALGGTLKSKGSTVKPLQLISASVAVSAAFSFSVESWDGKCSVLKQAG